MARQPKLRRLLPRPAATDDLQRAIAQATPKFRCWIVLAAYQGLRCQEIAGLRREDVLDTEGLLRVTQAKGGNERVLPLHPTVLAGLQALPMPRVGYVFRRTQGGPYNGRTLSVEFNAFLRSAQADCTAHQLRHWFGTTLYSMTKDLRLTQEMMGHASPTTTAIYTAFDREAATHAVSALSMEK